MANRILCRAIKYLQWHQDEMCCQVWLAQLTATGILLFTRASQHSFPTSSTGRTASSSSTLLRSPPLKSVPPCNVQPATASPTTSCDGALQALLTAPAEGTMVVRRGRPMARGRRKASCRSPMGCSVGTRVHSAIGTSPSRGQMQSRLRNHRAEVPALGSVFEP